MPRSALIAAVLVAAACSAGKPPPAGQDMRSERRARLDEIARGCGFPVETLKLVGREDLHIQPPPDASYESLDCLLTRLKRVDFPLKMGFVGSEVLDTGNQQ
jgi:hypothetical protein